VPTAPRPSSAHGDFAWRLISHLTLNYLSLTNSDSERGAAALRDLLTLYGDIADATVRKQIDGVKSISSRPVVQRIARGEPIAFGRGLEVAVLFDEAAFEGTGAFLLGAVLERFFAKYVSINSFTKTIVRTVERGEVMQWPARYGQRQIL
jgi:type VI secretion system protein ImpG